MFNRLRRNLRGSILTAFSVLLLLSFALVGGIFNFAVGRYIRYNAIGELNTRENYIYIDSYFNAWQRPAPYFTPYAHEIAMALFEASRWGSPNVTNRRLRTENGVFFVTSELYSDFHGGHIGDGRLYRLYYVDITDISRFSARVNLLLFFLVAAIWAVAMIITTFLAHSLAQPLRSLNCFARRIGSGDFTPNGESFANEEFETLNQSLNNTARQLAKYDNDQKTFFQNVSHELRTPLMSIKSYAEGIKYGIMDTAEASDTILDATNRLTGMVDDILYVSRIDNITTPHRDTTDLCELIAERINLHETPAQKGMIQFHHTQPIVIPCIKNYIARALDNLISNALRYAKTRIDISCHIEGTHAVIRIIDDGPGFEPDSLPHVFERFYRGKNGLTGIGLAIVKSIVDQHGGTASAENTDKGTRLTIKLPMEAKL